MIDFGMTSQEFRTRYLEKEPFLHRAAMQDCSFGWSDLDTLLQQIEPHHPDIQLFNHGPVDESMYVDELIDMGLRKRRLNKQRFYQQMQNGATLVLNRLENNSAYTKRLCAAVGRFAGHPTLSNGYLTLGGEGAFGKHWDTHDVFAIQLIGGKRWQLFPPTLPYPLSHQISDHFKDDSPKTPIFDCVLNAGDVLYVPRGWWHQVMPLDKASFHLSVGVYIPTVLDYILWACSAHLPRVRAARKGLLRDATAIEDIAAALQVISAALVNPACIAEFKQDLALREVMSSEFNLELLLGQNSSGLTDATTIGLNSCYELSGNQSEIMVNNRRIQNDRVAQQLVKLLSNVACMRLGAVYGRLPHISKEQIHSAVLSLARHEVIGIAND